MDMGISAGSPSPHGAQPKIPWERHRVLRRRATLAAVVAAAGLFTVYLGVLGFANSLDHAWDEMARLWYWMLPLIAGFALQVGLFAYARLATRGAGAVHAAGVAASGGTSALSMVACCAHHLTDVLPLIGLAGVALVLAEYQALFLLLGVLSNVVGFVYLLGMLQRHGLYPERGSLLAACARLPLQRAFAWVAGVCGVIFVVAVLLTIS